MVAPLDHTATALSNVRTAWNTFLAQQPSRDSAGDAIYSAIFDAAPELQHLFKRLVKIQRGHGLYGFRSSGKPTKTLIPVGMVFLAWFGTCLEGLWFIFRLGQRVLWWQWSLWMAWICWSRTCHGLQCLRPPHCQSQTVGQIWKGFHHVSSRKWQISLGLRLACLDHPWPGSAARYVCQANTETLSFQHLDIDVTTPRAGVFRDAICELLQQELGSNLTTLVRNPERERERERQRERERERRK